MTGGLVAGALSQALRPSKYLHIRKTANPPLTDPQPKDPEEKVKGMISTHVHLQTQIAVL